MAKPALFLYWFPVGWRLKPSCHARKDTNRLLGLAYMFEESMGDKANISFYSFISHNPKIILTP